MIKEIKYLLFIFVIFLFLFLTVRYYISDTNKKNSYRSFQTIEEKIISYSNNLIFLKNNTANIIEYINKKEDDNKKNYNFWKLIEND